MASQTSNWILSASMVALALCCGPPAGAEPKKTSPFQAALESLSVKSEGALVAVAIDYADVLSHEEIFRTSCPNGGACRSDPNGWYLDLAPEIHIAAGDNGAFQSFTGKLAGNFVYFRKENLNDIPGALAAYKKGLELEPTNETLKAGLAEVQHSGASSACCCVACDANATQSRFPCDSRVCAYACMHACKRMCDDDDGDDGARTANEIKSLGVAMKVMWTAMDWWAALEGNPSESNCVVVCLRILFRFAR